MKFSKRLLSNIIDKRYRVLFVSGFFFLIVLRNGFTLFNPTEGWVESINQFPKVSGFTSSSIGSVVILKVLQVQTSHQLIIVNSTISLTLLLVSLIYFSKMPKRKGVFLGLTLSVSPLATHTMSSFGNPDVFLYLGWLILFSAKNPLVFALGVLVVATAHPYQAFLGAISLFLISLVFPSQKLRRISSYLIPTCLIFVILISLWSNLSSYGDTRESLFVDYFAQSVTNFLTNFPNSVLAYLGPIWLIVVLAFLQVNKIKQQMLFILAVIILPMIFAISTADGTRVYLGIIFPTALIIIKQFVEEYQNKQYQLSNYFIILIALLLYPVTYQITDFMYTPWMGLDSRLQPFVQWWASLN